MCRPVGFHFIRPLKRPISSSSVQGSVERVGGEEASGCVWGEVLVDFEGAVVAGAAAGELGREMRDFFFGGMVGVLMAGTGWAV